MFKVRIQFIGFAGNEEKYPCHFGLSAGDQVIFDGEKYIGKLCPDVWPIVAPKVYGLHAAGPRYVDPVYYYPHWYAPPSVRDVDMKKYDGLGFRNLLKTHVEPQFHMANNAPQGAWTWPPHGRRDIALETVVSCPDPRTVALFKLEAFDLSDLGYNAPWFRRQMAILSKVSKKPGIARDKILDEFSNEEKLDIYPALSPILMQCLIEELEIIGFLETNNGATSISQKGKQKLDGFKRNLDEDERKALKL